MYKIINDARGTFPFLRFSSLACQELWTSGSARADFGCNPLPIWQPLSLLIKLTLDHRQTLLTDINNNLALFQIKTIIDSTFLTKEECLQTYHSAPLSISLLSWNLTRPSREVSREFGVTQPQSLSAHLGWDVYDPVNLFCEDD